MCWGKLFVVSDTASKAFFAAGRPMPVAQMALMVWILFLKKILLLNDIITIDDSCLGLGGATSLWHERRKIPVIRLELL